MSQATALAQGQPGTTASEEGLGVPGALARRRTLTTVVCAVLGALLALSLAWSWQATTRASADAQQVVRVQTIKANLLRADALATNAFLIGGLEPASQREAYDQAVADASQGATTAAEAQPADRTVIAALGQSLLRYTSFVEQARATNRQGLPVGSGYLRQASSELRTTTIPDVDALVKANSERADSAMSAQQWWIPLLIGIIGLLLLLRTNSWIANRFRRRFNVGLVTAAAILAVLALAAAAATWNQGNENATLRTTSYRTVVDASAARSAANDAKANESLRLIARGSGQTFEDAWSKAAAGVDTQLDAGAGAVRKTDWDAYRKQHADIVKLDDNGQWDAAVKAATSEAPDSATAKFNAFDTGLSSLVASSAKETTGALGSGGWIFPLLAVLALIGGGVAAATAWGGVSRRLQEYDA